MSSHTAIVLESASHRPLQMFHIYQALLSSALSQQAAEWERSYEEGCVRAQSGRMQHVRDFASLAGVDGG